MSGDNKEGFGQNNGDVVKHVIHEGHNGVTSIPLQAEKAAENASDFNRNKIDTATNTATTLVYAPGTAGI